MQTKQKKKKITVADILRAVENKKFDDREKKFSDFFPRTIDSVKPIDATGKTVAEDSIDKAAFQNMIPEAVMDYLNDAFIGYQACSLLKQNAFIDRACSIPSKDAIAPDFKISYQNKKDDAADELTENVDELADIQNSIKKFNVKDICIKQNQNKKVYGYSITIPIVENADMSKPFNIDGIKPGMYKGLTVIEPYWLTPELDYESARNPASKHYFTPTWYNIQGAGVKIHRSWVIRSVNSEVADILKPTYFFGGIPLTQQIFKRVFAAEKVANEAPMLAMTKRLLVVDANIMNMVANPEQVSETMNALTELRDNWGVYAKNPGDQVQQIDTSLADFDALIMTQYQLIASIAGMPATKLLKTTPKGFNATGEYEQKDYNQALIEIQENDFIPILDLHFKLYTKSRYGRAIPLNIVFNPIDTPSEKEIAEIANAKAMIAMTHINAGITTATEERQILRNEEGSPYSGIDEEIEEPELPPDILDDTDNDGPTETTPTGTENEPAAANDAAIDADFNESDHPRDNSGKFTSGNGGTGSGENKEPLHIEYRKRDITINGKKAKINEVALDEKEYASVMAEVDTHATDEDKSDIYFSKPIDDFLYRFVYDKENNLFYVIGKKRND